MRRLFLILIVVSLLIFTSCSLFQKDEPSYNIKLRDEYNLVNDIPGVAHAGDIVKIRVTDKSTVSSIVKIKDVDVEKTQSTNSNSWIYSFIMPEHDITVIVSGIQK